MFDFNSRDTLKKNGYMSDTSTPILLYVTAFGTFASVTHNPTVSLARSFSAALRQAQERSRLLKSNRSFSTAEAKQLTVIKSDADSVVTFSNRDEYPAIEAQTTAKPLQKVSSEAPKSAASPAPEIAATIAAAVNLGDVAASNAETTESTGASSQGNQLVEVAGEKEHELSASAGAARIERAVVSDAASLAGTADNEFVVKEKAATVVSTQEQCAAVASIEAACADAAPEAARADSVHVRAGRPADCATEATHHGTPIPVMPTGSSSTSVSAEGDATLPFTKKVTPAAATELECASRDATVLANLQDVNLCGVAVLQVSAAAVEEAIPSFFLALDNLPNSRRCISHSACMFPLDRIIDNQHAKPTEAQQQCERLILKRQKRQFSTDLKDFVGVSLHRKHQHGQQMCIREVLVDDEQNENQQRPPEAVHQQEQAGTEMYSSLRKMGTEPQEGRACSAYACSASHVEKIYCESAAVDTDRNDKVRRFLLHLGLNTHTTCFELEQRAVNEATFSVPDERGYCPQGKPVVPEGPSELRTSLPLDAICATLQARGFSCKVSKSAGQFVCNYIFYRSLWQRRRKNSNVDVLFVHVPCFSIIDFDTQLSFLLNLLDILSTVPLSPPASSFTSTQRNE